MIGKSNIDTTELSETELDTHGISERDVKDCMLAYPDELLCENLFLIGEEIRTGPRDERIDLLGLDTQLDAVVIEVKAKPITRDHLKQALKYAPYVAERTEEDFSNDYMGDSGSFRRKLSTDKRDAYYDEEFTSAYSQFNHGDSLNENQRIVLVGTGVHKETMDVIDWLETQGVTVDVIEITPYEDSNFGEVILTSKPVASDDVEVREYQKWERSEKEAKDWHREIQASEKTKQLANQIISKLKRIELLNDPDWRQKNYISFSDNEKIRVKVRPRTKKVGIWLTEIDAGGYDEASIKTRINQEPSVTLNTDNNRIEFGLSPHEDDAVESIITFIADEL